MPAVIPCRHGPGHGMVTKGKVGPDAPLSMTGRARNKKHLNVTDIL